ncbi:MAG: GNAT family N-acetyltransferase [Balneolia bacterium]|nr:GNAT family N-acetyltransferase [Balneolia bacterium]
MSRNIDIKTVSGSEIERYIPSLAWLRRTVFHEFPYLYDGSDEYEQAYLRTYTKSEKSIFVLALDGQKVVGAASGMPLSKETNEVKKPFTENAIPVDDVFYFGESVLLSEYRGLGIGKSFILEREKHALSHGFSITAFCGVVRPDDHPRKPEGYRPLNTFWEKMGYEKQPQMTTHFEWQDLDESRPSPKEMMFWLKHHT